MQQRIAISMKILSMILMLLLMASPLVIAAEKTLVESVKKGKADQSEIKLKGLTIKLKEKEVHMDAQLCLAEGLLEYLMCLPDSFEHESLLMTRTKPELLHTGLLLIGMEPYSGFGGLAALWGDKTGKKAKSSLNIEIEMGVGDKKERIKLIDFLSYRSGDNYDAMGLQKKVEEGKDPDRAVTDSWIFTGSFFHTTKEKKKVYAANLGGVAIAIMPQQAAVIQFGEENFNPYQGDDNGLEISGEHKITAGTNVVVIFSKLKSPLTDNKKDNKVVEEKTKK